MRNKPHSRAGSKSGKRFNLFEEVDAIAQQKQKLAERRQRKAGVVEPIKTGRARPQDLYAAVLPNLAEPGLFMPLTAFVMVCAAALAPVLNEALQKIWDAGHTGNVEADRTVLRLYSDMGRGHACLTLDDVLALAKLTPLEIHEVAYWLTEGTTLIQAQWNAAQKGEKQ